MKYRNLMTVIREVAAEKKRKDQEELHKKMQQQNKIIDNP